MPEGTQLDLVSLATSYADAVGEVEIAKLEYESRKQLAERNTIPAQELAIAQIKFKTAERKVALLRSIAEAALMETKADMDAARSQLESVGKGRPDDRSAIRAAEAQVIRAESRLRVLESILASGGR
jgi:multidrug resistance efflux pump